MRIKPPKFFRALVPELMWEIPGGGGTTGKVGEAGESEAAADAAGVVYLTFDDGPTPAITEWILDELARWDAHATFFCLGRNVAANPELYRRIVAGGHRVANHTWDHTKGWGNDPVLYADEVDRAAEVIASDLFRPPYGRISRREAVAVAARGYHIVMWNVISRDYSHRLTPRGCLDNVVRHVRPGDIVVFHDSRKAFRNMSYALPRTLEYLRSRGLECKAIEL
jgi:peptidoglycan/xylan/chitin deacetylase (PgdA/CDA1 family)